MLNINNPDNEILQKANENVNIINRLHMLPYKNIFISNYNERKSKSHY
jgi:predicted RNA methylase